MEKIINDLKDKIRQHYVTKDRYDEVLKIVEHCRLMIESLNEAVPTKKSNKDLKQNARIFMNILSGMLDDMVTYVPKTPAEQYEWLQKFRSKK